MSDHDSMINRLSSKQSPDQTRTKEEEELAKWQAAKQELMIKQNREYLEDLFKENATTAVKIGPTRIQNAHNFRESFLAKQLNPLLSSNIVTIESLLKRINQVSDNFRKAGVIEGIYTSLEDIQNRNYGWGPKSSIIEVSPGIYLNPVKRFYAKTGTNIGNGEGDGYMQFQLKNLFGGGETLLFDAVSGTKTSSSYLINYTMPWMNNSSIMTEQTLYMNTRQLDWLQSSSTVRGVTSKLYTQHKNHNIDISWENCWRILSNTAASKAIDVMYQSGNDLKSAVLCNYRYDTRNSCHLPTSGSLFRLGLEYSFLNPFSYFKSVIETSHAMALNVDHSLIFSGKSGLLFALNPSKSSHVLDRFNIGGPNDVRSFVLNGLGPKSFNSSIGGDAFINGGISLVSRMPWTDASSGFKLQNFLNWGSLIPMNHQDIRGSLLSLQQVSVGYGFGILYNHPMARLELNFVLPLIAHERDGMRKGLQYGIGASFL